MLQQMRRIPRWVSGILFAGIALSFIVWGIADIFRGGGDTSVAKVGGTQIAEEAFSRDFANIRRNAAKNAGGQLTPAQTIKLGNQTVQREIDDVALDNAARDLGIKVSDDQVSEAIRAIPAFHGPLGTFDEARFRQVLETIGFTPEGIVAEIRREMVRSQLVGAASNGSQLPLGYIAALYAYVNERRAVRYVVLPPDAAGPVPPPTDAQLLSYTKAHAAKFSTPEYRAVTYATIGIEDAAKLVQVTDTQLRQTYELRKDTYNVPERRDIQRINFPDAASANAARAKLATGAKFEDIASQRGVSSADLDLGSLSQADLGPVQGPAAFALPDGGVTQPIKAALGGWVILRVTKITPGTSKTFEQAKGELKDELLKRLAVSKIEDVINAFEDARNTGSDWTDAARKVGMQIVHVAETDERGNAPDGTKANVPANPDFLAQVFRADVGDAGDPFALADGRRYIIKIDGVIPAKPKPLDVVRAQATADWTAEQRSRQLVQRATALAKQANATGDLDGLAAGLHLPAQNSPALERDVPTPVFNTALNGKIFDAKPGTTVVGPSADGASYILAKVTGVAHPPLMQGDPRMAQLGRIINNQAASDIQASLAGTARASQGVKVNQPTVDRILGANGS
jgi:peptidyl-prolyl cis-trans isomerase D